MPGVECCKFEAVEGLNRRLTAPLHKLLATPFFRYFKVALDKPCPFWEDNLFCTNKACAIKIMEKKPAGWDSTSIGEVAAPRHEPDPLMLKRWDDDYEEFCHIDRECDGGDFVDLVENPERFTGYAGEGANRIWKAIYEENCFTPARNPLAMLDWNKCEEKQTFYRIVSGLHASITVHLAYEWYNQKTNVWEANFEIFDERVGKHLDRLGNMYFDYMLLYRAITKLGYFFRRLKFNADDSKEDSFIQKSIKNITSISPECPRNFDRVLFASNSKPEVVDEMKRRFRNITRIMDCVSCERCRLWGKIQTLGVGTALKVLFASESKRQFAALRLQRSEIVALFNTFGRLSESITAVQAFREEYKQRQQVKKKLIDLPLNLAAILSLLGGSLLLILCLRRSSKHAPTKSSTPVPR